MLAHLGQRTRFLEDPRDLLDACEGPRVQLIGDAFVRPPHASERFEPPRPEPGGSVDPSLGYAGFVVEKDAAIPLRPARVLSARRPRLSVIVIAHDMRREAMRTVCSLLPPYQHGITLDEYEILVIDNGSTAPLDASEIHALGPNVRYTFLEDAPPSPAHAINHGVAHTTGDLVAIVIDGACLLSPGVLSAAFLAARAFPLPVVATRYFALGPGIQRETMLVGYDRVVEDRLIESIGWPADGYRLFEVASPLTFSGPHEHWFRAWFESNCLVLPRSVFERLDGFDERFDLPGGGLLNMDSFRRACELPDTQPVQLIGEGVFHQIHGGITSNVTDEDAAAKLRLYSSQYAALRARAIGRPSKSFYFQGALKVSSCRWKMHG